MKSIAGKLLTSWRRFSIEIAALLLFVQLPISALHKLSSWLLLMQPFEIFKETAMVVVVYAIAAGVAGLALAVSETTLRLLNERVADYWRTLWLTVLIVLATLAVLSPLSAWWRDFMSHLPGPLKRLALPKAFLIFLALLTATTIYIFVRRGWLATIERFSVSLRSTERTALVLVALAGVLVVATGHARWKPFGWSAEAKPASAPAEAPNIVLISIDTLAAKDMSLYGYHLPTTPNIDAFARSAHVFERFNANSNYTIPTITTMHTGRYPTTHRVTQLRGRLEPGEGARTMARVLQQNGYVTAIAVANEGAHPMYLGLSEAFDYQAPPAHEAPGNHVEFLLQFVNTRVYDWIWDWWCAPYMHILYPWLTFGDMQTRNWFPAERLIDSATEAARSGKKPLFLWTHFMSPHEPYLPPPPFLGRFLPTGELDTYAKQVTAAQRALLGAYPPDSQPLVDLLRLRYDEYIAYTDDRVQLLLNHLRDAGILDNAVVIITADHGQSFEKGWHGHRGPMLHQALIQIPFVIRLPGQTQGQRIAQAAEQVDLLPTVLDLAGLPIPGWAEGESLRPALNGQPLSGRPKFSFDLERDSRFTPPVFGNFAVIEGPDKFVHHQANGCEEFYNLATDPWEIHNLIGAAPRPRLAEMRRLLEKKVGVELVSHADRPGEKPPCPTTETMQSPTPN